MAELRKKEKSAESAVEKAGEKKAEAGGIKVEGAVKLGTIDYQAMLQQQMAERDDLRKQAEDAASKQAAISDELREKLHASEMQVLKTSFDAQMQVLTKMIEANASKGGFTEQLTAARAIADELGYQRGTTGGNGSEMIRIELKKLDFEHQVAMRRMAKEDKAEERKWQLELRRLDDERAAKRQELAQDAERNELIAKTPQVIANAFAQGLMANQGKGGRVTEEAPSGTKAPRGEKGHHVEAGWGETGEVECPSCNQPIAIGSTAQTAVCTTCGERVPIRRVGERPSAREEE